MLTEKWEKVETNENIVVHRFDGCSLFFPCSAVVQSVFLISCGMNIYKIVLLF